MKRLMIGFFAIYMLVPAFAQDQELSKKEQKALQKQLKKEQQAEEAAEASAMTRLMIEHSIFVLEADMLRDHRGNSGSVSSMINFIACDSLSGVIQIGSNAYVGANGVGGITVEGRISNYKFSQNEKNKSYSVSYNLQSAVGAYDVQMSVSGEGRADATIRSNWPGQLTYSGYLVAPAASKVYKGSSYY